jgi:hypothetical protein
MDPPSPARPLSDTSDPRSGGEGSRPESPRLLLCYCYVKSSEQRKRENSPFVLQHISSCPRERRCRPGRQSCPIDTRFLQVESIIIRNSECEFMGVPTTIYQPITTAIPQLSDLLHTTILFATATLDFGLNWLLYDLANSISIDVPAPNNERTPLETSIVLEFPALGWMMSGPQTIHFEKKVSNKGIVWWVSFSRVTTALATSGERQRDSEAEDSWAFTRIWYSRDQHHGKAFLSSSVFMTR